MVIISTDEDPGLQIESFAIIKIRGGFPSINYMFSPCKHTKNLSLGLMVYVPGVNILNAPGKKMQDLLQAFRQILW